MVKGNTKSGFKFEYEKNNLDNMELLDALSEFENDNPLVLPKILTLVLGGEQRKRLYEHFRTEDGRVPIKDVGEALTEMLNAAGEQGKN